jgi:hypothetical protein
MSTLTDMQLALQTGYIILGGFLGRDCSGRVLWGVAAAATTASDSNLRRLYMGGNNGILGPRALFSLRRRRASIR